METYLISELLEPPEPAPTQQVSAPKLIRRCPQNLMQQRCCPLIMLLVRVHRPPGA